MQTPTTRRFFNTCYPCHATLSPAYICAFIAHKKLGYDWGCGFLLYHIIIYLNAFYWDSHHLVMWRENFPVLSSHPYLDPKSLMSFENSSEILMNIATSLSEPMNRSALAGFPARSRYALDPFSLHGRWSGFSSSIINTMNLACKVSEFYYLQVRLCMKKMLIYPDFFKPKTFLS